MGKKLTKEFLEGPNFARKGISRGIQRGNLPECKYCGSAKHVVRFGTYKVCNAGGAENANIGSLTLIRFAK